MTKEINKRIEKIRKMSGPDYFEQIQFLLSVIDSLKAESMKLGSNLRASREGKRDQDRNVNSMIDKVKAAGIELDELQDHVDRHIDDIKNDLGVIDDDD